MFEQLPGPGCQYPPNFPSLTPNSWNHQIVVSRRLVTHPGNHRGLGPLLDRDPFGPGNCTASHGRRMQCHCLGQLFRQFRIARIKRQKRDNRSVKVFDVFRLNFFPSSGVPFFSFGETFG